MDPDSQGPGVVLILMPTGFRTQHATALTKLCRSKDWPSLIGWMVIMLDKGRLKKLFPDW